MSGKKVYFTGHLSSKSVIPFAQTVPKYKCTNKKRQIDHTQTYICIPYYVGVLWNIEKQLLTVWHKCPSKVSLSRRIRVLEANNMKFRQIVHTTSQHGQSFFPKTISAWNGLPFAEAPSLAVFRSHFLNN